MTKKSQPSQAPGRPDDFQTPPSALTPLIPYINRNWYIWEPAAGKGNLVRALEDAGCWHVCASDILPEDLTIRPRRFSADFLLPSHLTSPDLILTNPPFSLKDEFLQRCFDLRTRFALLMPLTALEGLKRQKVWRSLGDRLEIVFFDRRVKFETPSVEGSGSWFPVAWYTYGLNIGRQLTFWESGPKAIETDLRPVLFDETNLEGEGVDGWMLPEPDHNICACAFCWCGDTTELDGEVCPSCRAGAHQG